MIGELGFEPRSDGEFSIFPIHESGPSIANSMTALTKLSYSCMSILSYLILKHKKY